MSSTQSRAGQAGRGTAAPAPIPAGNIVAGMVMVAVAAGGLGWAARRWGGDVTTRAPHLADAVAVVTRWAWPAAGALLAAAVVAGVLVGRSTRRRMHTMRLTGVAAAAVKVRPDALRTAAKWRKGRPERGQISYPPGAIAGDPSDDLTAHLAEVYGRRYTATWQPLADLITFTSTPSADAAGDGPEAATGTDVETAAEEPAARAEQVASAMLGSATTTVVSTDEAGAPTEIRITYTASVKDASPAMQERMAAHLAGKMPGGAQLWRAELDPTRDTMTVRRKPALPTYVLHPAATATKFPAGSLVLPYATDENGQACGWDLNASVPHALIIGPTGGGKTVLLRGLAVEATRKGAEVWGCDPKRIELKGLRGWPGVTRVATSIEDMIELIGDAHALMDARYTRIEAGQALREDLRPLVVILDEYLILVASLNRHWKATKEKGQTGTAHPVLGLVKELVVLARSARIHLCLGVQRPDATLFDDGARDSIRHRVSLARLSPQGAMMLWENPRTGTDLDMSIRGRATALTSRGTPGHVQVWWTPDPDPQMLARNPAAHSPAETACLHSLLPHTPLTGSVVDELTGDAGPGPGTGHIPDRGSGNDQQDTAAVPGEVLDAVPARDLEPGQTVLLDLDDGPHTVAVEDVSPDPGDADMVLLEYREDDGASSVVAVDSDELMLLTH